MRPQNANGPHIRYVLVFWIFLAIALVLLALAYRAHAFLALPYLLLLACPLIHLCLHRRHGHGPRRDTSKPVNGPSR